MSYYSAYKTSSVNFQDRNQPSSVNSKLRTNSSLGRPNFATQGANIMKEDSKSKFDNKEDKLSGYTHAFESRVEPRSMGVRGSKGIVGLRNLGNTCYMNSILQCLVRLVPFREAMLKIDVRNLNSSSKLKGRLAMAFKALIEEIMSANNFTSVTPYEVKTQIGNYSRQFMGSDQQDSAELLRCFLEALNADLSRVSEKVAYHEMTGNTNEEFKVVADRWWHYSLSRDNSIVTDFFQGQLASVITCDKCGYGSISCDSFWSLNLPSTDSLFRTTSLDDCLNMYFKSSALPSSYRCEKCKKTGGCNQKISIFRYPNILVLQLKRFQVSGFNKQRLNTDIAYPEELNLINYKHERGQNPAKYMLAGISHHTGTLNFGHYLSHCKETTWYCFDDSRASAIETPTRSSTAYILFYVANLF